MLDILLLLLFLAGVAAIGFVVARDKGWTLPAGLAAAGAAAAAWFTDAADKVAGWF